MMSCRACRLDKCLLEGMDPTMVEAEQSADLSQFIQTLYKRREFLQQQLKEDEEKFCRMDTTILLSFVTIPLVMMNARFDSSKENSQIETTINNKAISPLFHVAGDKM
ncbi:hypothetical protein niasHT_004482 [Heterodera trifolii]|uniref:Nuclear receptor domain-containing protein n=1 Tax=Heterodera trifolii TaxID=157864 RepID=A0ABD2ME11_9BILA